MSADDAYEKVIGRFGKYQSWVMFLIYIGRFPTDFQLTNVVFILPSVEYECTDDQVLNTTNYCPCTNPKYDTSNVVESVTTTWNLICNKTQLASFAQSTLQIGILAGSLIYGYFSDRYGRKVTTLTSLITNVLFIIISGIVPKLWMFLVCRFLIGTSVGGTMLCSYILMVELSGTSFRPYLTGLTEMAYVTASIIQPMIAYYVREWRYLQLVTSVPWIFVVLYYWLLPESPRWLLTMGKKKEAVNVLTKIAKWNNRPTENIGAIIDKIKVHSLNREKQKHGSYLDLFKTTKLRIYTIVMAIVWFCCAHTFFGINQYIGRLQGNFYFNVMLSGFFLLPGVVLSVLSCLFLQRKVGVIVSFLIAAVSLTVFIFIPSNAYTTSLVFAILGQMGAYMAFIQIYLYTSEVFPTVVRNSAMGFASMSARVGGFAAPFVVNIGVEWASITVFSTVALIAGFSCFLLPKTKDTVLLNTIQQTEQSDVKVKT
ncbi:Organic cation transporter-like protein [Papilio machaon]|uniref:Organic cation transporter-like protein n=1 Tax=Papilio machaon TaxID=76193 RepID=A0A194QMP3_PAPMA|nr:Organic cation transporter-like protein [Papilio machaon]